MEDALTASRLQFAFTVTYHYLFPMFTMGLALLIFVLKSIYMRRRNELYNTAARFWGKIFAVTFVFGVVTGIPLEFQFGTNWAAFSAFTGDIIAQTLAMEGAFAFFLESAFVGLFLFGERRFGQRLHWFSTLMIFLGTWASAYFIITTNSWMQNPVGYRVLEKFRARTMKVLRYAFLSGFVLEFMTAAAIALVAVTLGVRVISGSMPFEEAFVVLLLAPEFYKPLRELGAHRHAGMEGSAAAERIFEVLNTPVPTRDGSKTTNPFSGGLTIEFSGVGYAYPESDRAALSEISLTLEAGTRTALVGRSGSGKSTLVSLLMRFVEPGEGSIRANGVEIADLPAEFWRENLALVPQRPHLFYGSVLENIRLARPGASREEVQKAAELAGAAQFIRHLPDGYETRIRERGTRLSGGEAQRVAIARAFLKDAPVLVMDEPTSSLDPESERLIRASLELLARDRTVLVVAHRLNTVYGADRITVLDDGRLAETGTHGDLIQRDGLYARLVSTYGGVAV